MNDTINRTVKCTFDSIKSSVIRTYPKLNKCAFLNSTKNPNPIDSEIKTITVDELVKVKMD